MSDLIHDAVNQLQAIARKNQDEFRYRIEVEPAARNGEPPTYVFQATEKADGRTFVEGRSDQLHVAVTRAVQAIPVACESWGYQNIHP